jgi:PAS domain S-box-containing protein
MERKPKPRKRKPDESNEAARQEAERNLSSPTRKASIKPEDVQKLFQELQIHEAELEMQNEELRRAQAEIEGARSRYAELYELAPVGYFTLNRAGLILQVNFTGTKMLGADGHLSLIKTPFQQFVVPQSRDLFWQHRQEVHGNPAGQLCEIEMVRLDGTPFRALVKSVSIHDGKDKTARILSTVTDITLLREAEEARLRLEAAVEQASDSVLITDPQGVILYLNPAFESLHGYARRAVLGKKYEDILRRKPEDQELKNRIQECIRRGLKWSGRDVRRRRNGPAVDLQMAASPVKDQSGKIVSYLFVGRDVTEEARLQQQVHQAQKMEALGTLAGGIAHDFNNLLMSIFINTDLALLDSPAGSPQRSHLEQALKAANVGHSLVKQILAFSRPTQGKRHITSLYPILKQTLQMVRASIPSTVEIRQNIEARSSMANVNPDLLQQVLVNLCSNAAYAMRGRTGLLEVGLAEVQVDAAMAASHSGLAAGPYIKLTVKDTGLGIDPRILDRVFEPFFTTKKPHEGTGLGLSVVHGIVKGFGGTVTVSSVPGQGSTFEVFLPRVEDEVIAEPPPSIPQSGNHERILVVDDEETVLQSLQSALEYIGYRVTATNDSLQAWDFFRDHPEDFELLMTDQVMPRMTGMELAGKALALRPELPVVLITGYSEDTDEDCARTLGLREFVRKPISTQTLSEVVHRVLEKKG